MEYHLHDSLTRDKNATRLSQLAENANSGWLAFFLTFEFYPYRLIIHPCLSFSNPLKDYGLWFIQLNINFI